MSDDNEELKALLAEHRITLNFDDGQVAGIKILNMACLYNKDQDVYVLICRNEEMGACMISVMNREEYLEALTGFAKIDPQKN